MDYVSVASVYIHKFKGITNTKAKEPASMKPKIRTYLGEVEAWFERNRQAK
jgi:hypothetical protein